MHGNIVTLCGMSSFVMLSEGCLFKESSEKKESSQGRHGFTRSWYEGVSRGLWEASWDWRCVASEKHCKLVYTYCSVLHYSLIQYTFYTCWSWPLFFRNRHRDVIIGQKGFTVSLTRQHYTFYLQYILSGSWSSSLSVADAVMASSTASASGSTCTQ